MREDEPGESVTTERILPPAPRPSSPYNRVPSVEADFWKGLFLDLTVRVEWLQQAIDAVPTNDASASAVVRLRSYAQALQELHTAIDRVQARRPEARLKPLFGLDGPLAAYLSRLYAWCAEIGDDFERMARALRRREAAQLVFSHHAVNRSYAQFDAMTSAIRTNMENAQRAEPDDDQDDWRSFSERVEELIWAVEWVHLALTRPPGE